MSMEVLEIGVFSFIYNIFSTTVVILFYLIVAIGMGLHTQKFTNIGFLGGFLLYLLCTPMIAAAIIFYMMYRKDKQEQEQRIKEQEQKREEKEQKRYQ